MITLETVDVTKSFGGIKAVDNVSISFESGQITALIGPNGAGKTTLFHLITGMIPPDNGQILYKGQEIQGRSPWEIARLGIGRLFQDVRIFPHLTVLENVLTAFKYQPGENPLWTLLRRKKMVEAEHSLLQKARYWLNFVGLEKLERHPGEALSFGQQKLLSLARLLANEAEVLLLDEPTAGVNPEMIQKIIDLIQKLAHKEGKTIVVIEHNMNVVLQVADWVFFMDEGRIEAFGKPEEVLAEKEVREAYIGL